MKLTLFEYAILLHPKDQDGKTTVVVAPTSYLSNDENTVKIHAARQIPKELEDQLDFIEIIVTRF